MPSGSALVVGCGHPDRGDDAVGFLVVEAVRARSTAPLDVRSMLDPLLLVSMLADRDTVVVVDAAVGAGDVGSIAVHDVTHAPLTSSVGGPTSTHGLSVAAAVELCRATAAMPRRMLVLTVTGDQFAVGTPPQPAVRAAVDAAARAVLALLDGRDVRTAVPG